jgi:hypothetical protein
MSIAGLAGSMGLKRPVARLFNEYSRMYQETGLGAESSDTMMLLA